MLNTAQPKARRNLIFQRIPLNNGEPPKKSVVKANIKLKLSRLGVDLSILRRKMVLVQFNMKITSRAFEE